MGHRSLILLLALVLAGCDDNASESCEHGGAGAASGAAGGAGGSFAQPTSYSCSGADCPACAQGTRCAAPEDQLPGGSCCGLGDAIVHLGSARASEAVDVVSNGEIAVLCGGFGATVLDVSTPATPVFLGSASARCQRAAIGEKDGSGQLFYVAHHGDSWVDKPQLQAWRRSGSSLVQVDSLTEPGVLYEGLAWFADRLYVAAHTGGLRIYDTAQGGAPRFLGSLAGLSNAWTVALDPLDSTIVYVADFEAGVRVVDVTDPASPKLLETVATTGPPRQISSDEGRVYVALGGFGVDVFDRVARSQLASVGNIATQGTAQAVAANGDGIAVAAWSHVAVYDRDSLRLVGTEKLIGYPGFEQDLGVAMQGSTIFVAEWNSLRTLELRHGYIAPDLWVTERQFQFSPSESDARSIVVRNRGDLPLEIAGIEPSDTAFVASAKTLSVPAGGGDFFEIAFTPPSTSAEATLCLSSNDPDPSDAKWTAGLTARDADRLGVGDTLEPAFGFLDPSGNNQLNGLKGKVIVLAYFALF